MAPLHWADPKRPAKRAAVRLLMYRHSPGRWNGDPVATIARSKRRFMEPSNGRGTKFHIPELCAIGWGWKPVLMGRARCGIILTEPTLTDTPDEGRKPCIQCCIRGM